MTSTVAFAATASCTAAVPTPEVFRRLALGSLPAALATLIWLHQQESRGIRSGTIIIALGSVLILTAVVMVAMPLLARNAKHSPVGESGRFRFLQPIATVICGVILGVLVTLTSIGAGALGAVMMLFLYPVRLTPARLVATDLAHAIPLALVAGAGHLLLGHVDFRLLGYLLLGSLPGVWIGAHFGGKLPDRALRIAIAIVLGVVGFRLIS